MRKAILFHVSGSGAVVSKELKVNRQGAKVNEDDKFPPRSLEAGAPNAPYFVCDVQMTKVYTHTMWIPASHAVEGYAPGILTDFRAIVEVQSVRSSIRHRSRPSSGVGMLQPQPQRQAQLQPVTNLDNGK